MSIVDIALQTLKWLTGLTIGGLTYFVTVAIIVGIIKGISGVK